MNSRYRSCGSTIDAFFFTNQLGKQVTENDVKGKVYVASYFFTTCKGICPEMNANLKKVYEKFKDEKDFLILSHTSDPAVDSVPRMRQYAEALGADPNKWIFLTGRKDSLYNMARFNYAIDDPANNLKDVNDIFKNTGFISQIKNDIYGKERMVKGWKIQSENKAINQLTN